MLSLGIKSPYYFTQPSPKVVEVAATPFQIVQYYPVPALKLAHLEFASPHITAR